MSTTWSNLFESGLIEDGFNQDVTTQALRIRTQAVAIVRSKSEGVWAAEPLKWAVLEVARKYSKSIEIDFWATDATWLSPNQQVILIKGDGAFLLGIERTLLNLSAYASGVASHTHRIASRMKHARLACTRKILPHYREILHHAVQVGGGHPHRFNLASGILIKENHIALCNQGVGKATQFAKQNAPHLLKIEVEVRNLEELNAAVRAGADIVMLDNFTPPQIVSALEFLKQITPRPLVEVSGSIHESNVNEFDIPGVDILSSGAITHSAKSLDLSMLIEAL